MATRLFLRETTVNGHGTYRDMHTTAGSSTTTTGVVNTTASGTEIQWTKTAGGAVLEWISGRVPSGGFTLSGTMTFHIRALESNMNANIGGRVRVFRRQANGTLTEVGGGPYNDGVEFGTAVGSMDWTGTPTSTAFNEDDRIVVRYYITNVGTMASGHTGTIQYDGADAGNFDSSFQINETVSFKENVTIDAVLTASAALTLGVFTATDSANAASPSATATLSGTPWSDDNANAANLNVTATLLASAWSTDSANAASPNGVATLLASAWSTDSANAASLTPTAALVLGVFTAIDNDAASRSATATLFAEGEVTSPGENFTAWAYTRMPRHNSYIGPV